MVRGVFITMEGCEGTGKSTQATLLALTLTDAGFMVKALREPGATRVGEAIRGIVLDRGVAGIDARTELLLYEASRAQLMVEVIVPSLASGAVVVCDRFTDSTVAYQGYGRGLPLLEVAALNEFASAGVVPDVTVLLDFECEIGLARAVADGADRLEGEDERFHRRVRDGFLAIARAEPDRVVVVDASGTKAEVASRVLAAVKRVPVLAAILEGRA